MNEDLTHEQTERYYASAGTDDAAGAIRRAMTVTRDELRTFAIVSDDAEPESYVEAFERIGFIVEPEPIEVPQNVIDAALKAYRKADRLVIPEAFADAIRAALREMNAPASKEKCPNCGRTSHGFTCMPG